MTIQLKPEQSEQIAFVEWSKWYPRNPKIHDYLVYNPNDGKRSRIVGYIMKLMGLKPGVSDMFFAYPYGGKHGLWIELKQKDKKKAKVSPEQIEWINKMRSLNYGAEICYGFEEAKNVVLKYLGEF